MQIVHPDVKNLAFVGTSVISDNYTVSILFLVLGQSGGGDEAGTSSTVFVEDAVGWRGQQHRLSFVWFSLIDRVICDFHPIASSHHLLPGQF